MIWSQELRDEMFKRLLKEYSEVENELIRETDRLQRKLERIDKQMRGLYK